MSGEQETIVGSAILLDGVMHFVMKPGRHNHVINQMADAGCKTPIGGTQGFITSKMRFVDREEGAKIAIAAKQLVIRNPESMGEIIGHNGDKLHWPPLLYSEDVW